jgi:energy-coupling factor transporter ATP-binding protein EcfA2
MILSAGGRILSEDGQRVFLGPAAERGVNLIGELARSSAADPSLSVQIEDQNRLAFESGNAAFELNYPFIYPSALQNAPKLAKQIGWVEYPRVDVGRPSAPPVGGIDLAVSPYSRHKEQAFDAILCLRNRANQLRNAVKGGLPLTLASLYRDPRLINGDRDIAMVFQDYALYPHMTVRDNMAFALKLAHVERAELDRKVDQAAELPELGELLDRTPANLAGGQRQRVAMGRAIVRSPQAFLLDEPLSNLDAKLRVQPRTTIARLQNRLGTTTVYVTHDQTEP